MTCHYVCDSNPRAVGSTLTDSPGRSIFGGYPGFRAVRVRSRIARRHGLRRTRGEEVAPRLDRAPQTKGYSQGMPSGPRCRSDCNLGSESRQRLHPPPGGREISFPGPGGVAKCRAASGLGGPSVATSHMQKRAKPTSQLGRLALATILAFALCGCGLASLADTGCGGHGAKKSPHGWTGPHKQRGTPRG